MKTAAAPPLGHRVLGREIRRTPKAMLLEYYGTQLWLPLKALVKSPAGYSAPLWAVDAAKRFNTK